MTFLTDLAQHLQNIGLGTMNTDIFVGYAPSKKEACVALFETSGLEPDPDLPILYPTFQVFIRATTHAAGKAKMDQIFNAYHRIQNTTIGNSYFYYILAIAQGGHIGRNEAGQDEFSVNFKIKMRGTGR